MTSEPTKAIKALPLGRPYHISYGGWQDLQYVDDVAKAFVRCLEAPYQGAKTYNLRGDVVDLPTFHRALCAVEAGGARSWSPTATADRHRLRPGRRRPAARPGADAEDAAGGRASGRRWQMFRQLQTEGRLDTADLDAPKPPPVTTGLPMSRDVAAAITLVCSASVHRG